jgi:hypothetical protein
LTATEIDTCKLASIQIGDFTGIAPVCKACEIGVMTDYELSRTAQAYVELDPVGARSGG